MIGGVLTVEVVKNDITRETSEVITNAANGRLAHGAGVAGAIAKAAGRELIEESRKYVEDNG